ncbi:unnamed protein product [Diatraea saccharalis]|uniref:RING-type domain-containing protein n=1 Tax=Diatraea saccharalis TaxID=40085 RepID=A0A9N9QW24_9NEOP|nr:unnamed protein product [Diatraea saccharalis]
MVTSNKLPEKKFVKMTGQSSIAVVPQRTLLGEVNEQITCPLCRGYYIDATTIVECLHSFCRSCIIKHLQVKSYCPVCEMMINSAKPNIKLDKALQDIVYKLVPGLFQKEMERRQQFYASRPGPAASATPEQRGEDTERIIFSPEDVISFSLEYADITDSDSISSKSSDSNETQPTSACSRRYLQCPAVVNISHLKKFLSMKFDIDSTQFAIDILYKRVPLPDYYTLMDIAYIYNWKRNEPMRFFYQIKDYIAIRNRFFDINRKSSDFRDRKSSPTSTEETNVGSPAPNLNDHVSEGSSGAESPMPDENSQKQTSDTTKNNEKSIQNRDTKVQEKMGVNLNKENTSLPKKSDDDVEKSQFLNSFELTAKSSNLMTKSSPAKLSKVENDAPESTLKTIHASKIEDTLKRKHQSLPNTPELKKLKIELEKTKIPMLSNIGSSSVPEGSIQNIKILDSTKAKDIESSAKKSQIAATSGLPTSPLSPKEVKPQPHPVPGQQVSDSTGLKRSIAGSQNSTSSPKRKLSNEVPPSNQSTAQKTVSPLKLQIPKLDTQYAYSKSSDVQKLPSKKLPDLKPSMLPSTQNKGQPVNKVRMDLLANNSDPTIDRSKILSQVKSSLIAQNNGQGSGDPLKSIFDSCNINIPSSLSITLTDQKLEPRNPNESASTDPKKSALNNKNIANITNSSAHKIPSPPVHNYIEILKLPDTPDSKMANKTEVSSDTKSHISNKSDSNTPQVKNINKSETSAKGPIPNLKPISDTKLSKQASTGNFTAPITFQQTFEQQLQSLQTEKKPKLPKAKTQVPKLVPAPKVFNVGNKSATVGNKPNSSTPTSETKPSSALDLSTQHNIQNQQQTFDKALETMQSIANLAKKQNLPSKGITLPMSQSNTFSGLTNRSLNSGVSPIRVPSANVNQIKPDKSNIAHALTNTSRQDTSKIHPNKSSNHSASNIPSPSYQMPSHSSPSPAQPSPRSQTRSPSCSPKLVIAEDKQTNSSLEQNTGQTNSMTNMQKSNLNSINDIQKSSPGPSKPALKPIKPSTPSAVKVSSIRPPMALNPSLNTTPDYLTRPQLISTHHHLLRQMEVNAWLKVQRQFDLIKSMSNMAHQPQNDFNGNDNQQ